LRAALPGRQGRSAALILVKAKNPRPPDKPKVRIVPMFVVGSGVAGSSQDETALHLNKYNVTR
jgi:hypothetical protein